MLSAQPRMGRNSLEQCFSTAFFILQPPPLPKGSIFKAKLRCCNPGVPPCNSHLLPLIFPPDQSLHQDCRTDTRDAQTPKGRRMASGATLLTLDSWLGRGLRSEELH